VEDNTVNGKPLVYLEDASDYRVEDAGQVILVNCNNITVENLDLSNTSVGIELLNTEDSNILNNTANNNSQAGIYLNSSSNNTITGNNVSSTILGISLPDSSNNTITGNTFVNSGLHARNSYQNTVEDNTVNGKPLVYLEDASDYKVEDAGQVILVNCNNITVENLDLSNTSVGIELLNTEDSNIINNTVSSNNWVGIRLSSSSSNTITGNNVSNNKHDGIDLYSSSNNTIRDNNASNNNWVGIDLSDSSNNSITGNNASNNNWDSIRLDSSSNNTIYLNNFINNNNNADYYVSTDIWNSPFEITYTYDGNAYTNYLGNYWDDYEGTDAEGDGIGDTPYSIDSKGDKNDDYPLMKPNENYILPTSAPA
jgi:parallel beta-helix repeat protein